MPHEGLWARDAQITGHQVVEGAYVVYQLVVTTMRGTKLRLWRRYAEFDALRAKLLAEVPAERLAIPTLPPKSSKSGIENTTFLKSREEGLCYFVRCVFLNPHTARSAAVKRFISNS